MVTDAKTDTDWKPTDQMSLTESMNLNQKSMDEQSAPQGGVPEEVQMELDGLHDLVEARPMPQS